MNPLALIPGPWKLAAAAIAVMSLLGLLGTAVAIVEKHGEDKATAVLQPKLDKANRDIGVLSAAHAADEAAIAEMRADAAANDALVEGYASQVAALDHEAETTAAAIRKLQSDDQTVDAYLRTPVPAALRGVLMGPAKAGNGAGAANQNRAQPAAH